MVAKCMRAGLFFNTVSDIAEKNGSLKIKNGGGGYSAAGSKVRESGFEVSLQDAVE